MNIGRAKKASQWLCARWSGPTTRHATKLQGMRSNSRLYLLAGGLVLAACGGSEPNHSPAVIVVVSGNNQTGGAGQQLAAPLIVRVNDKGGDPVADVVVTFAVTAGGGSVQTTSGTTDAQGRAGTLWIVGTAIGAANTVTATSGALANSPLSFSATVQAAPAAVATIIQGDGQAGFVGAALSSQIQIEFRDAFDNPASSQDVAWLVTGGGGSISATAAQTDASGLAFATWTLGYQLGNGHTLTVHVGGVTVNLAATGNLTAGSTLTVSSGNNQTGVAGQALAAAVSVRVQTATAHSVSNVPVAWNVQAGGGSVAQLSTLTNVSGIASVSWTLGAGSASQTVSATNLELAPTSVTLAATAVVPPVSSIVGTVTVVDNEVSPIRVASRSSRSSGSASRDGFVHPHVAVRITRPKAIRFVPGDVLVRFKASSIGGPIGVGSLKSVETARSVSQAMLDRLVSHTRPGAIAVAGVSPVIRTARLKVTDLTKVDSIARALIADPAVEAVGPNPMAWAIGGPTHPGTVPNDRYYPDQSWMYAMLDLPRAWSITTGSSNVIVAVLDNGIVFHHPSVGAAGATSLTGGGNLRNDGYDFVNNTDPLVSICFNAGGGSVNNSGDGDGYDNNPAIPDDRDPSDPSGCLGAREPLGAHGTHVAGTIGALGNDGNDVAGINWHVSIRPVRVLGLSYGSFFDIAQGILYASGFTAAGPNGQINPSGPPARIINLSLGGDCPNGVDPIHTAIQTVSADPSTAPLIVASAGNEQSSVPSCPASYPEVLSVGAVGPTGLRASYSSFGSTVDIAAPGGEFTNGPSDDGATYMVLSSVCDFTVFPSSCTPGWAYYEGTSMAAPHVAGVAALLLAQDPSLTAADLRTRLVTYATPIDPSQQIGPGIVNARNALTQSFAPARQLYVRAVNATSGAAVATVAAPGGNFTISNLPDGSYFVVAGEDEAGDGVIGQPGRHFGAFGGSANPTAVAVSSSAGGFAAFTIGQAAELEPNNSAGNAGRLEIDGSIQGRLGAADETDLYRIQIPTAGTYSFETTGFSGAYCGFALELNTVVSVLDQNQLLVANGSSDDINRPGRNFCSLATTALQPGPYFVQVTRGVFFNTAPHQGRYVLQAREGP
jgi:subtilisin family serine protease